MKKILCYLLAGIMLFASFTAVAEDNMADALASVKSKIEIPENLSEFHSSTAVRDGKTQYIFEWAEPEGDESILVNCFSDGVILRYNHYSQKLYENHGQQLTTVTREDAKKLAEDFIRKLIPEIFSENDLFVFDDVNVHFSENGTDFNLSFVRQVNGVLVEGEIITVDIRARGDKPFIASVAAAYDRDIVFDELNEEKILKNKEELYKNAFPVQLTYKMNRYNDEDYSLVYVIKDGHGYISALTGEKVLPYTEDKYFNSNDKESLMDSAAGSGGAEIFTPQELEELETVASLISVEDAISLIEKEKDFYVVEDYELEYYEYSKRKDSYMIEVELRNEEKGRTSFVLDAQTKELVYFYSYYYDEDSSNEDTLTDAELKDAEKIIKSVVSKYSNEPENTLEMSPATISGRYANQIYTRFVNNIPVTGNGITVSYNADLKKIISYNKAYAKKGFPAPENILSSEEGYNRILELCPVTLCYLNTGETYSLCYKLDYDHSIIELNAKTGEHLRDYGDSDLTVYNDIENHWCETAVKTLAEAGISLKGESFEPEKEITQLEMLRLFGGATRYISYLTSDPDNLYKNLEMEGIISEEERADNSPVLREDAFVYLIRFLEYEKIAKVEEIFTTKYADQNLISPGKIGYASILSGLKVINGNGGYIKPLDKLTRAEAAVMIYNLLTNIS